MVKMIVKNGVLKWCRRWRCGRFSLEVLRLCFCLCFYV